MMRVFRGLLTGLLVFLVLGLRVAAAPTAPSGPAFSSIPELEQGHRLLYEQKLVTSFRNGRRIPTSLSARSPLPPATCSKSSFSSGY